MRWIRRAITVAFILLIAAGVNILVAWIWQARAIAGGVREIPPTIPSAPIGVWPEPSPLWPPPRVATASCAGFDATTYTLSAQWTPNGFVTNEASPDVTRTWLEIRVGVPFRCASQSIRQENWFVPVPPSHVRAPNVDDGLSVPGITGFAVPCRPLWPGLIASTGVIAVPMLFAAWLFGRFQRWLAPLRRLRMARGLCGTCGYDGRGLASGAACPECGTVR